MTRRYPALALVTRWSHSLKAVLAHSQGACAEPPLGGQAHRIMKASSKGTIQSDDFLHRTRFFTRANIESSALKPM